jgi:hypothetical protein
MKLACALTTALALVALTAAPAVAEREWQSPADGFAAQHAELRAQAEFNDLSPEQVRTLQARVDQVVARTGGTQVAINQVVWDGGDTLIPLPGEKRARELGAPTRGTVRGCAYYQFCTYGKRDFSGMVDRMSSCTWHVSHGFFVAYVNNQTRGTTAKFYNYFGRLIGVTPPAFYEDWRFGNSIGHETHFIRPC